MTLITTLLGGSWHWLAALAAVIAALGASYFGGKKIGKVRLASSRLCCCCCATALTRDASCCALSTSERAFCCTLPIFLPPK